MNCFKPFQRQRQVERQKKTQISGDSDMNVLTIQYFSSSIKANKTNNILHNFKMSEE